MQRKNLAGPCRSSVCIISCLLKVPLLILIETLFWLRGWHWHRWSSTEWSQWQHRAAGGAGGWLKLLINRGQIWECCWPEEKVNITPRSWITRKDQVQQNKREERKTGTEERRKKRQPDNKTPWTAAISGFVRLTLQLKLAWNHFKFITGMINLRWHMWRTEPVNLKAENGQLKAQTKWTPAGSHWVVLSRAASDVETKSSMNHSLQFCLTWCPQHDTTNTNR